MQSKVKLYILVSLLVATGVGLTFYKSSVLGFPLLPGEKKEVWTIEATVEFAARNEPVEVSFALPTAPPDLVVLDEDFASSGYGFTETLYNGQRRANWTTRSAEGPQHLYYRLDVYEKEGAFAEQNQIQEAPEPSEPPELDEPFRTAAQALVDQAYQLSASPESLTTELLKALNSPTPSQEVELFLGESPSDEFIAELALQLLAQAKVPARIVRGLYLEDGRRRQSLTPFIEVYNGTTWVFFDQKSGQPTRPEHFILWQRGGQSLLDVVGGAKSRVFFSIIENARAARDLAVRYGDQTDAGLVDFSIYSLPIQEQNAFKSILLVPIGALVVVITRILIGLRTSGTFMPILIALAFIQTTLWTGLLIFLLVVGTGLIIRSYLSRLNLLLVARISAVIIVVVGIMAGISILSHKLGFGQALTVTFFPMIILAWTIERMSILWEEEGPHEVMMQGGGSLLVAVIAYLFMSNRTVEYMTFNFPELLLVILAMILVLGHYTGYRLLELRRFQPMIEEPEPSAHPNTQPETKP